MISRPRYTKKLGYTGRLTLCNLIVMLAHSHFFAKNDLTSGAFWHIINTIVKRSAGVAHLVERHLAKVEVASSSLVVRSKQWISVLADVHCFY